MANLFKIGNRVFNIESIARAEYATKNKEIEAMMNAKSYLHVYMTDGKDFTLFNESADLLWDVLCSSAMTLQN